MICISGLTIAGRLADVNLVVRPGELVAVVGSRGSGKTTLMRALAGQVPVDGGSATVNGSRPGDPSHAAKVGAAGEAWGLLDRLTVWENLSLFARLWGVPEQRIPDLLQRLDLEGRREARADRLTPGEAARLRLARALLHDPPALLLDEPVGDIDSESASLIAFTVAEEAEAGKAVLVTTFGDPRILRVASRICYLEGGRLIQASPSGGPADAALPTGGMPAEGVAATLLGDVAQAGAVKPAPAAISGDAAAPARAAASGDGVMPARAAASGDGVIPARAVALGDAATPATAAANGGAATPARAAAPGDAATPARASAPGDAATPARAVAPAEAAAPAGTGAPVHAASAPAPHAPVRRLTPHVAARKGVRILLFRPDEIRYAYAREKAVYIETTEGTCAVSFTLTELEERLAEFGFFRSHKAYLVNLAYVKEIASWTRDAYSLILKGGEEVPLSKHRAQELRVRLNW